MEMNLELVHGLGVALKIASAALALSVLPGTLLYFALKSNIVALQVLAKGFTEIIEGIPLIVQLFVVYYIIGGGLLPIFRLTSSAVAIIVLSLIGMSKIAKNANTLSKIINIDLTSSSHIKILLVIIVREWGRLVNYTSLLSIIGLNELTRSAKLISNASYDFSAYIYIIMIYLGIHFLIKLITHFMINGFFNTKSAELSDGIIL